MAMMEIAAGISALFDADGKSLIGKQKRLDLHTRLSTEAADFVKLFNDRENDDAKS